MKLKEIIERLEDRNKKIEDPVFMTEVLDYRVQQVFTKRFTFQLSQDDNIIAQMQEAIVTKEQVYKRVKELLERKAVGLGKV